MKPTTKAVPPLEAARAALADMISYEDLVAKLRGKDQRNFQRHVETSEQGAPDHARLWTRLARALYTLSAHDVATIGEQAMQFFIADGRFKMQVFALEDAGNGLVHVYGPDVTADAVRLKVLTKPTSTDPNHYGVPGDRGSGLHIESLDANNTPNPAAAYKNMLGWNRRAMRITISEVSTPAQLSAAETLCALAAGKWVKPA